MPQQRSSRSAKQPPIGTPAPPKSWASIARDEQPTQRRPPKQVATQFTPAPAQKERSWVQTLFPLDPQVKAAPSATAAPSAPPAHPFKSLFHGSTPDTSVRPPTKRSSQSVPSGTKELPSGSKIATRKPVNSSGLSGSAPSFIPAPAQTSLAMQTPSNISQKGKQTPFLPGQRASSESRATTRPLDTRTQVRSRSLPPTLPPKRKQGIQPTMFLDNQVWPGIPSSISHDERYLGQVMTVEYPEGNSSITFRVGTRQIRIKDSVSTSLAQEIDGKAEWTLYSTKRGKVNARSFTFPISSVILQKDNHNEAGWQISYVKRHKAIAKI